MVYIENLAFFLIGFALVLTSFQFINRDEWWIRISDFVHVQLTVMSLVSWVTLAVFFEYDLVNLIFIFVGIALFILHLVVIIPYTPIYRTQSKNSKQKDPDKMISVLESNILQYNRKYDLFLDMVNRESPDIVVAIETDKEWQEALDVLEEDYKHTIKYAQDNTYGLLLYSRLPLRDSHIEFLVEDDVPSFRTRVTLRSGQEVILHVLHPKPPSPTENYLSLERDAELIIAGRIIADLNEPVILAGDLNDVAWSHTSRLFNRISGLLDPRIGRGFFNTFHTKYALMRWPLDHVFHSNHFLLGKIRRMESVGSDHFPMYIELYLEGILGKKINEETDDVSESDEVEIEDKLDRLEE
ncbi:MAG: endonuclease/exonuclease/phosphatase family protein [Cyclobacteriaceae bacterium]